MACRPVPVRMNGPDGGVVIRPREIGWAALTLLLALGLLWVRGDAAERRAARLQHQDERDAAVRILGTADLFLSSSSRWIRHPSISEPGAAFQEMCAGLDVDPAGGLIGPAPELLAADSSNRLDLRRADP